MTNRRSNKVIAKPLGSKTTKMDERKQKPANKTGKQSMVYPKGHN